MDKLKEKGIHFVSGKVSREVVKSASYQSIYNDVQIVASSPEVSKADFPGSMSKSVKERGIINRLRNTVFHWLRSNSNFTSVNGVPVKEELAYLRKAQLQWEKRIQKSLNSMCLELDQVLSRLRPTSDREEFHEKWAELSTYDIDLSQYRPVYAPKDFLEVLLCLRSPNFFPGVPEGDWEFCMLPIKVKAFNELKSLYQELTRGEPLLGVNPNMPTAMNNCPTLEMERTYIGEKVIASNHAPLAQEFLKKGCPRSLRGKIWAQVLGSEAREEHVQYFRDLKMAVLKYDMMVDKLIIKDVQLTASNDDQYFVFEDVLYQVMLSFSRDTDILYLFNRSASNPMLATLKSRFPDGADMVVAFPPCGITPFHGFTMYATPFCYIYDDPVQLYYTFRAFYVRYLFRLHEVSSHQQGILCLCLLFERLLQCHEPELWLHFKAINIQPVRVVFKWLMRGFSGHLPPEQLLFLWDLVLAYDSLEILSLLAVSILSFRRENLLEVNTLQHIEAVLADLSSVMVMPLLQLALMRDSI